MQKFLFIYWKHPIEPLGIMYLSAALKKAGHDAKIVIVDMEDYKKVLLDYKPDVVCGSILTGGQQYFEDLILDMKKTGHKFLTIMGGIHPTFHPKVIESSKVLDVIITGEAEEAIVDFANALENKKPYNKIPNVWAKTNGKIYKNEKRPLVENLDLLEDADRTIAMEHEIWRNEPIRHFIAGRGCPYKCTYCWAMDTYIHTNKGMLSIKDIVESQDNFKVMTGNGSWKDVIQKHKRQYKGNMIKIKPTKMNYGMMCTPNHRLFIYRDNKIQEIEARQIKDNDKLCIPVPEAIEKKQIDILEVLKDYKNELHYTRKVNYNKIEETIKLFEREKLSTRKIATRVGLSKTFVHQIIQKYRENGEIPPVYRKVSVELETSKDIVRFSLGKLKISRYLDINRDFMRLIGYYLAEGNVTKGKHRSNSYCLTFSFGKHEEKYINDTYELVEKVLKIKPVISYDKTSTRVAIYSNVIGLLFKNLFGNSAHTKKVPDYFMGLEKTLQLELLKGYMRGDGHYTADKSLSAGTVSRSLANQLFMISYKIGCTPSIYQSKTRDGLIDGRKIKGGSDFFTLVFGKQKDMYALVDFIFDDLDSLDYIGTTSEKINNHVLLPIEKISEEPYDGFVYNLGIDQDHTYTANNIAVHNCFNHAMVKNYGPDSGKWVRFRSVERVIKEVKDVMKRYGGKMVYFQDDTFIVNRPWIQKFTEMYRKEINIPYHCHIRANLVDEKMAKMLADSNCYSVHMAIEAGNDHIRNKILKREMSREEIFRAANLLNKYGIKTMLQNMVGLPTGTIEDDLETLKINIKCKPTYAWCSIFQPYPGVELTEFAGKQGLLKGDYNDISAKFFNDTVLKMDPKQKKEMEYLHKWFAVAANHPILYYSGALRLLMKAPKSERIKKLYGWVYQKYRENRDNKLYGIQIWTKKNKIKMIK